MNLAELESINAKCEAINSLINEVNQFADTDLFRNYKWREYVVSFQIIKNVDKSFELLPGSHGDDYKNSRTERGEMKSSNGMKVNKKGKVNLGSCVFEFDKQNDSVKRQHMLGIDSYVFAFFLKNKFKFLFYVNSDAGVEYVTALIKAKHEKFIATMEKCAKIGKRIGRDSITISAKELLECPEITIFNEDGEVSIDSIL